MQGSTSRSKRARLKAWFLRIFHSDQPNVPDTVAIPSYDQPDVSDTVEPSSPDQPNASDTAVPSSHVNTAGVGSFANAHDFVMNNPSFYDGPDKVTLGTFRACIDGAEFDSSVRDPPPLCHPGTRVQLLKRLSTWFHDENREKPFLWLSGPAGVGKSAVIQTFAESLAESESLGATLFFSRLNDRKDPQRIVATISFQLAIKIPTYRTYLAERVTLDPSSLRKGMKEQFEIFIAEPFGNQNMGEGEGPWGVLLDGLDECEDVDQQCNIVRLVSQFVLNYPNAPLLWTIASRPEPHIANTFANEEVVPSHWSEYIPINSTEGCKDVERYLNISFKTMRGRFSHVPSDWPKETQFLKLANGASGLFVFARTAVRFMEDPDHADPITRLDLLLSIIDHLDVDVTDEHPFALLDALYNQILTPIPSKLWPITKRVLGFFICSQARSNHYGPPYPHDLDSSRRNESPSSSELSISSRSGPPHPRDHNTSVRARSPSSSELSSSRSKLSYHRGHGSHTEIPRPHSSYRSTRNESPAPSELRVPNSNERIHRGRINPSELPHPRTHDRTIRDDSSSSGELSRSHSKLSDRYGRGIHSGLVRPGDFDSSIHKEHPYPLGRRNRSSTRSKTPSSIDLDNLSYSELSHHRGHRSRSELSYRSGRSRSSELPLGRNPDDSTHYKPLYPVGQLKKDTPSGPLYSLASHNFMAASIVLKIEQNVAYSSLHKLHSVLEIPRPENAHKSGVSLLHASFADYLTDPARSKGFYINRGESVDDIASGLYRIYIEKPWDNKWAPYSSRLSRIVGRNFYQQLKQDAEAGLYHTLTGDLRSAWGRGPFRSEEDRSECLDVLSQINVAELCWSDHHGGLFIRWLLKLWESFPDELKNRGLIKEVPLANLNTDYLNHGRNKSIRVFGIGTSESGGEKSFQGFSKTSQEFKAEFRSLQQQHPGKVIIVCGSTPERRNVFIHHNAIRQKFFYTEGYYCVPYPCN